MNAIESYIINLPKPHAKLMFELREIILHSLPKCEEKISFKTPFFYYLKWLCYLYVPAKQKDIVALGFCQGAQLSNEHGLLTGEGKLVRLIEFDIHKTYDMNLVRETIQEAVLLQEILYKKK